MPDEELFYHDAQHYSGPTSQDKCGRYVEPLNIGALDDWDDREVSEEDENQTEETT